MKKSPFIYLLFLVAFLTACSQEDTTDSSNTNPNSNTDIVLIDPSEVSGTGNMSSYSMVIPPEWNATFSSNDIVILNTNLGDNGPILSIQPIVQGSGNLENDMNSFFFQVFAGWQLKYETNQYYEKGKTIQGFPYYIERKTIQNLEQTETRDGALLLVQLSNNKVGIIAHIFANSSTSVQELNYLLFSLRFNQEAVGNITISKDIIGPWSLTSLNSGAYMTYYGDGYFTKGGATSFTVGLNETYNQITTTQFSATGNYKLNGNQLEDNYNSNNTTNKRRIRFYTNKLDQDAWLPKMGSIDLDNGWHFQFPSQWDDEN
jgi:hypothetical protein